MATFSKSDLLNQIKTSTLMDPLQKKIPDNNPPTKQQPPESQPPPEKEGEETKKILTDEGAYANKGNPLFAGR